MATQRLDSMVLALTVVVFSCYASYAALVPPQVILDSQKTPDYPPAALAGRYEGTVTIETTVLVDGRVGDLKVIACTRPKVGFEEAATTAIREWRFEPANEEGRPVSAMVRLRLTFSMGDGAPRV